MSSDNAATKDNSTGPPPEIYSERLFGRGVYGRHHGSRFAWLEKKISALASQQDLRVLEVGCHDGRTLSHIPRHVRRYVGFDAGWGGGLDRGRKLFAAQENYSFIESTAPRDVASLNERFDFIICMETLEHLDPFDVELYIQAFSEKLDGLLLITVPNEKGLALLIKATGARVLGVDRIYPYTAKEFFWGLLGRLDRVKRSEHKGFDYAKLVALIKSHFKYVLVEGVSPVRYPLQLGLTIGIVASQNPIS